MKKYDHAVKYFSETITTHMERTEELNDPAFQKEIGLKVDTVGEVKFELYAIAGGDSKRIGEMTVEVEGDT
jgi:hypothetical protein